MQPPQEAPKSGCLPACLVLAGVGILLLFFGFFVAMPLLGDADDVLRAYPSPERHAGVDGWELSSWAGVPDHDKPLTSGDFDGDGTADELSSESFHMAPLFRRPTSGMVYVRSGRTGRVLLAHAAATFTLPRWCGDRDGNGTDEVLVLDGDRWIVLGFRGGR